MATPLRKDQPREELSTADLAQGRPQNRPEPGDAKPVASERVSADASKVQPIRDEHDSTPLFPNNELDNLRNRWKEIQTAFVDEPRKAVEQADGLVASAMKRLAEVFAEERRSEEHTSELQSQSNLVCRLLLEKKKKKTTQKKRYKRR